MKINISKAMNKMVTKLPSNVTRPAGKVAAKAQKHSPEILFATGVVGFGATVYLSSRATLKAQDVVTEHNKNNDDIEKVYRDKKLSEEHGYTEEDYKRDKRVNLAKTIRAFAKLYSPAIIAGCVTLGSFTGAQVILNNRNAALVAAYATLDKAFENYRDRVVEEFGAEKDEEFRYNIVKQETKDSDGKKKSTKTVDGHRAPSQYARFFDEGNPNWQSDASINRMFLSNIQNHMNDVLIHRGHVFLNEVYDALGIERTPEGSVVGWVLGERGDDFIDFGIFGNDWDIAKRMFVNGDERSVLMDFNVNGVIWDKI